MESSIQFRVDIAHEAAGPFRLGVEFPLPIGMSDDNGVLIGGGDLVFVEFENDFLLELEIAKGNAGLRCCVSQIQVYALSGALLFDVPMAQASLAEVMRRLNAQGVRERSSADTWLYLTPSAVSLGVFRDEIEFVMIGGEPENIFKKHKTVTDSIKFDQFLLSASEVL